MAFSILVSAPPRGACCFPLCRSLAFSPFPSRVSLFLVVSPLLARALQKGPPGCCSLQVADIADGVPEVPEDETSGKSIKSLIPGNSITDDELMVLLHEINDTTASLNKARGTQ